MVNDKLLRYLATSVGGRAAAANPSEQMDRFLSALIKDPETILVSSALISTPFFGQTATCLFQGRSKALLTMLSTLLSKLLV